MSGLAFEPGDSFSALSMLDGLILHYLRVERQADNVAKARTWRGLPNPSERRDYFTRKGDDCGERVVALRDFIRRAQTSGLLPEYPKEAADAR